MAPLVNGVTTYADEEELSGEEDAADNDTVATAGVSEAQKPDDPSEEQITPNTEEPAEVIIDPPEDYQSTDEEGRNEQFPPPPITGTDETTKEPVEDDVTESEQKLDNTDAPAEDRDEPDRKMKASEFKPSDVAIHIEMERQCGDCHSTQCTCNVTTLLVSHMKSQG